MLREKMHVKLFSKTCLMSPYIFGDETHLYLSGCANKQTCNIVTVRTQDNFMNSPSMFGVQYPESELLVLIFLKRTKG